ncbi:AraC family transcriptional regulator [Maledivibacter halophilus]|uniref:AraC-type DNA-binding protein n=1 Tax=Maledivibacter halophilus TaxID=36842 RepID=A0A1T5M8V8_9FIRM|nr:AraC family transcriptional regulator [Maledivibacter halophilus]SKC84299.1 AraC-type DNA-binding protein [Maledivibacter halophilus]
MNKININIVEISKKINSHNHPYAQIVIPLESYVYIQTNDEDFRIDNKSLGFIAPNCYHRYRSKSGKKSLVINIPNNMIKKADMDKLKSSSKILIDERISLLIKIISQEIEENPDSESVKYLFFYLYDKIIERKKSKSIEYINKYYNQDINITQLANIEHYNVNYYSEWFKKQTGMRPRDYIQKLRIEKAKELLITTNYSITEISNQVGYDHSSSFCRVFKLLETMSPTDYRNLNH